MSLLHCFRVGFLAAMAALVYGLVTLGPALKPYGLVVWHNYTHLIGLGLALVCFNVTSVLYEVTRGFGMKTTGRKLEHMDRTLGSSGSVMAELGERLEQ